MWDNLQMIVLSPREAMIELKVAMGSLHDDGAGVEPLRGLCRFREEFYSCLGARADAQFELTDALLCMDGPVRSLVDLSLARSIAVGTVLCTTGSITGRLRSPG